MPMEKFHVVVVDSLKELLSPHAPAWRMCKIAAAMAFFGKRSWQRLCSGEALQPQELLRHEPVWQVRTVLVTKLDADHRAFDFVNALVKKASLWKCQPAARRRGPSSAALWHVASQNPRGRPCGISAGESGPCFASPALPRRNYRGRVGRVCEKC